MWHLFGSSSCRSVAKFARMLKIYILLCAQQESIGSQNLTLSPATELSCTLKTASDWLAYTKSHGVCLAPANLDAKPNRHNKLYRCFLPIEVWPCNESHLCEIWQHILYHCMWHVFGSFSWGFLNLRFFNREFLRCMFLRICCVLAMA